MGSKVAVVDLFCGVGGLTCGLRKAGLDVVAGIDNDASCRYAYEENNLRDLLKLMYQDCLVWM